MEQRIDDAEQVEQPIEDMEILEMGERMIRLRFAMDSGHLATIFREMSIPDYLILSNMVRRMGIQEPEARVYLSEISKELELPINRVSLLVQNLQNKGYVYWTHDSKGTYIYLSEIGREVMKEQRRILQEFIGNVIERMGKDEFVQCVEQMDRLEEAMGLEAERYLTEEEADGADTER